MQLKYFVRSFVFIDLLIDYYNRYKICIPWINFNTIIDIIHSAELI